MIHRNGYIDFLKGISIFFVILTHNLPYAAKMLLLAPYWMYLAVPIFLAIQVYHISKRDNKYIYYTKEYIIKLFSNVIIPYVMTQLLVFAFQYIIEGKVSEDKLLLAGVGAYYIYIYIQFYFIAPLLVLIYQKLGRFRALVLALFLDVFFEILWSCLDFSYKDYVYRYCCCRYLFLIYLSLFYFNKPISKIIIVGSIIGAVFIFLDVYVKVNLEPFFFNGQWGSFHWIAYFYTIMVLSVIVRVYEKYKALKTRWLLCVGENSYVIFLCQMFVFSVIPVSTFKAFFSIESNVICYFGYVVISFLSIFVLVPVVSKLCRIQLRNDYK